MSINLGFDCERTMIHCLKILLFCSLVGLSIIGIMFMHLRVILTNYTKSMSRIYKRRSKRQVMLIMHPELRETSMNVSLFTPRVNFIWKLNSTQMQIKYHQNHSKNPVPNLTITCFNDSAFHNRVSSSVNFGLLS